MRIYANVKILFRKPLLYPAELRDRPAFLVAHRTPRQSASRIFESNDQIVTNRAHNVVTNISHSFSPTLTNGFVFNLSDFSNVINPATEGVPEIRILGSQLWKSGTNYITPQSTFQ